MSFQWDPGKALANLRTHGVDIAAAALALEDDPAITLPDVASASEARCILAACEGIRGCGGGGSIVKEVRRV